MKQRWKSFERDFHYNLNFQKKAVVIKGCSGVGGDNKWLKLKMPKDKESYDKCFAPLSHVDFLVFTVSWSFGHIWLS